MAPVEELGFTEENTEALRAFLSRARPAESVAVFDLDGTCLHGDAGEITFHAMARQGLFDLVAVLENEAVWDPFRRYRQVLNPRRVVMDYLYGSVTVETFAKAIVGAYLGLVRHAGKGVAYRWPVYLLAGKSVAEIKKISREALARAADRPLGTELLAEGPDDPSPLELDAGLAPYRAMRWLIDRLGEVGVETWVVTASNRITAQVCAEMFLGIPEQRVLGIAPRVTDGCVRGELDPDVPVTFGRGKVEAIEKLIGKEPVFAAGDSVNQLPMLDQATELKLVIHKGDPELLNQVALRKKIGNGTWLVQPRFIDSP